DAVVSPGGSWVTSSNSMQPRIFHNLTILPTGQVLVTGGLSGHAWYQDATQNPGVLQAELWDPDGGGGLGQWIGPLDAEPVRRGYHSTAMLLPDGRVISAGGETTDTNPNYNKPTILCPPYLFADAQGNLALRPVITSAPTEVTYGQRFTIYTPQAGTVSNACLIRASAVTEEFNQDQRHVRLTFVESAAPV